LSEKNIKPDLSTTEPLPVLSLQNFNQSTRGRPLLSCKAKEASLLCFILSPIPRQKLPGALLFGVVHDIPGGALFYDEAAVHEEDVVGHLPGEGRSFI